MADKVTLSVIKASVGGFVGRASLHHDVLAKARECLVKARERESIVDFYVTHVGDDLDLILTHDRGEGSREIHKLAWDVFISCTEVARKLKLFGAGQDLLSDAFSGTLQGLGPSFAELEFVERRSETLVVLLANKCGSGAWNLPAYKIYADPFNTPGLVLDPAMRDGFAFEVLDTVENKIITLQCPGDLYDLLLFLGAPGRFVVNKVIHRLGGEVAAVASTSKVERAGGRYVGRDHSVMLIRCHGGLPTVGEVTEAFSFPHTVSGWMRGSHQGPLMPVSFRHSDAVRFDGPPRVVAAGFQLANGRLVGPLDLFDDPAFDNSRRMAADVADRLRRHGPFEPHLRPHSEMEDDTFGAVMARLRDRFVPIEDERKRRAEAPARGAKKDRNRPVSANTKEEEGD